MNVQRSVRSVTALVISAVASVSLVACGGEDTPQAQTSSSTSSAAPVVVLPTAVELNDVLARIIDPHLPIEEKSLTIEDGDKAGDYFDIVTKAAAEKKIHFEVIDPVLPGFSATSAVAGVRVVVPGAEPRVVEQIDFLNKRGRWMLSKDWACRLSEALGPEHKPGFCLAPGETPPPPPPASEPAPEPAPVPAPAPEPAPPAPAPAPRQPPPRSLPHLRLHRKLRLRLRRLRARRSTNRRPLNDESRGLLPRVGPVLDAPVSLLDDANVGGSIAVGHRGDVVDSP
nr:hypothetical protein [Corynebacterium lactis]